MKVEGKLHQLAARVIEHEAEHERRIRIKKVDLCTPRRKPVESWGAWRLDAVALRLVNAEDHLALDLVAAGSDPATLWTVACHAVELGQVDVVRALAELFPSCAVCRPSRLSPVEVAARLGIYARGGAPMVNLRRGPIREER